jgi:hypothetical protein
MQAETGLKAQSVRLEPRSIEKLKNMEIEMG